MNQSVKGSGDGGRPLRVAGQSRAPGGGPASDPLALRLIEQARRRAEDGSSRPGPAEILTESQLEAPLEFDDQADGFTVEIPGYHIVREISRGGQAVVLEATRDATGRRVA